ncbi:hypothetical protein BST33_03130 [Mycolicibacter minnesotensis]|uniref:Uncharacterized protein n=1 Tax=Mycolicibacter minnesotensis TaxID=1118379 RepID=A0AA91RNN4_9MYCO|nr:hypothetical protein [Mycolicibacter minnesotensis]ORB03923.1 hypothetical protein BST33_03130 [Mycolicibacter minnesotensis]
MVTSEHRLTVAAQARTRMFARVLGPFLFIVTAAAIFRAPQVWADVENYGTDPLALWATGAFTLLIGLIVVALHPYWRGPAAIFVSATGWITTLKGLALTVFPDSGMSAASFAMRAEGWTRVLYALFALIGLYLTYIGWVPSRERQHDAPAL